MSNPSVLGYALINQEATWAATTTATKDAGLLIDSVVPAFEREIIQSASISAIELQKLSSGMVGAKLTMSGAIQHGRLFDYILGEATHALTSTDTKHTFAVDNAPKSMTAEIGINATTDIVQDLDGLLVESAEISVGLNSNLSLTSSWIGRRVTDSASASSSTVSTLPIFPHPLCNVEINGVAATEVQNASITITKTIGRVGGVSSVEYQQGHATSCKFAFSATVGFSDKTYHDLMMGGTTPASTPTAFDFQISADNGVTLGSGRREFLIALENCVADGWDQPIEVEGIIFLNISGEGLFKEAYSVDNIAEANWS